MSVSMEPALPQPGVELQAVLDAVRLAVAPLVERIDRLEAMLAEPERQVNSAILSLKTAAELLSFSERHLRRMMPGMPAGIWTQRCDGGKILFDRERLLQWMQSGMPKRLKEKKR